MRYRPVKRDPEERNTGGFVENEYAPDGDYDLEGGFVSEEEDLYASEQAAFSEAAAAREHEQKLLQGRRRKAKKQRRRLRTELVVLFALLLCETVRLYGRWARPPEINLQISAHTAETETPTRHVAGRKDGCYTFLIAGKDQAAGLTDTVLMGMRDARNHTLRFVSSPRDTAVNISWGPKKINQYYPAAENRGEDGTEALLAGVEKILGYRVDSYAIFDVDVFVELVDTMGGVYFDVPIDMHYEDPGQDLYIHVNAGYQKLSGYDTMGVFRFRSSYVNGDIGRLDMQHALLKSIASQMLSLGNIPNVKKLVEIFEKHVITDLSAGNVMYYLQEFLKMDEENIVFDTIPANYGGEVHGMSYVIIYLDSWLTYLNEYLNPYTTEITVDNVDIIYATSSGALTATTGAIRGNDRW